MINFEQGSITPYDKYEKEVLRVMKSILRLNELYEEVGDDPNLPSSVKSKVKSSYKKNLQYLQYLFEYDLTSPDLMNEFKERLKEGKEDVTEYEP